MPDVDSPGSDTTITRDSYIQERIADHAALLPPGGYYSCASCYTSRDLDTSSWCNACEDVKDACVRWLGTGMKCQQDPASLDWITLNDGKEIWECVTCHTDIPGLWGGGYCCNGFFKARCPSCQDTEAVIYTDQNRDGWCCRHCRLERPEPEFEEDSTGYEGKFWTSWCNSASCQRDTDTIKINPDSEDHLCCSQCRIDRDEARVVRLDEIYCGKCEDTTQTWEIDEVEDDETESGEDD